MSYPYASILKAKLPGYRPRCYPYGQPAQMLETERLGRCSISFGLA